jgi:uncharacterized membrane protein YkvA (DUF1232 family)
MSIPKQPNIESIDFYAKKFDLKKATLHQKKIKNSGFADKFKTMLKMVGDKEFSIDPKTKLIYVGALAYIVMPFDAVPDYLPGLGLLDDAAIVKIVWDSSINEVKRYLGFSR